MKKVEQYLISLKSIGVSTLHEAHSLYAPTYDNEDNSNNPKLAHGFSYHNGPEWVWLYGFYISGKAIFDEKPNQNRLLALLQEHAKYI